MAEGIDLPYNIVKMSSLFGLYYYHKTVPPTLAEKIAKRLDYWHADKIGVWTEKHIALGVLSLTNTPQAKHETQPYTFKHCVTISDSRLDNRKSLCQQLNLNPASSDSQIITHAYLKWHEDCAKHLLGDFSFAIWNKTSNCLFCARDHIGVKPLHYFKNDQLFAIATETRALLQIPEVKAQLDEREMLRTLTTDILMTGEYTEKTPYKNIYRLTPAHQIQANRKSIQKKHYWKINTNNPIAYKNEQDYVDHYKSLLDESVKARLQGNKNVFSELSGGIDSSMVSATAAKFDKTLTAITHAAPKNTRYLDETKHAKRLCAHANIKKHLIIDARKYNIVEASKHIIRSTALPSQVSNPTLAYNIMQAVNQNGGGILLSGFGGDECATNHGTLLSTELAQKKAWGQLWREQKSKNKLSKKPYLKRFLALYLKHSFPKLYATIKPKSSINENVSIENLLVNHALIKKLSLEKNYDEFRKFYQCNSIKESEQSLLTGKYSWHLRARIENSNLAAIGFKFEYRYPLLDIRLLEFCINLPSHMKRKNGWGRYIARQALQNLIPNELQWRQDKAGSPVPAALHKIKEEEALKNVLQQTEFTALTQKYFGNLKPELFGHPNELIQLYALRSGLNALQFQLLQDETEELSG